MKKKTRITKKLRDDAACILSAVANGAWFTWVEMRDSLGVDQLAIDLAWDTVREINLVDERALHSRWQYQWAEGEAMLRTGFVPPNGWWR